MNTPAKREGEALLRISRRQNDCPNECLAAAVIRVPVCARTPELHGRALCGAGETRYGKRRTVRNHLQPRMSCVRNDCEAIVIGADLALVLQGSIGRCGARRALVSQSHCCRTTTRPGPAEIATTTRSRMFVASLYRRATSATFVRDSASNQ